MGIFKKAFVSPIVKTVISQGIDEDIEQQNKELFSPEKYLNYKKTFEPPFKDKTNKPSPNANYHKYSEEAESAWLKYKEVYKGSSSPMEFLAGWNAAKGISEEDFIDAEFRDL